MFQNNNNSRKGNVKANFRNDTIKKSSTYFTIDSLGAVSMTHCQNGYFMGTQCEIFFSSSHCCLSLSRTLKSYKKGIELLAEMEFHSSRDSASMELWLWLTVNMTIKMMFVSPSRSPRMSFPVVSGWNIYSVNELNIIIILPCQGVVTILLWCHKSAKKRWQEKSRREIEIIKRIPGYCVGAREMLFGLGKKSRRNVESIRWVIIVIPRTFHSSLSRRTQKHAKHNKQTISLSMRWKMHQRTLAGRCERGWKMFECAGVECRQLEVSQAQENGVFTFYGWFSSREQCSFSSD